MLVDAIAGLRLDRGHNCVNVTARELGRPVAALADHMIAVRTHRMFGMPCLHDDRQQVIRGATFN